MKITGSPKWGGFFHPAPWMLVQNVRRAAWQIKNNIKGFNFRYTPGISTDADMLCWTWANCVFQDLIFCCDVQQTADGDICQKRHRVLWLDITGIKTHVALTFTNFSALSLYGTAIRANFSLVHILCMRPVYRTRRGCTQRAHQRAADNHGEQTKPDTFMPGYTQQTHCAPGSSGRALLLLMFHRNDFYCPVHLTWAASLFHRHSSLLVIAANCWAAVVIIAMCLLFPPHPLPSTEPPSFQYQKGGRVKEFNRRGFYIGSMC